MYRNIALFYSRQDTHSNTLDGEKEPCMASDISSAASPQCCCQIRTMAFSTDTNGGAHLMLLQNIILSPLKCAACTLTQCMYSAIYIYKAIHPEPKS